MYCTRVVHIAEVQVVGSVDFLQSHRGQAVGVTWRHCSLQGAGGSDASDESR